MKPVKYLILCCSLWTVPAFAVDLQLADGPLYRDFSVSAVTENGVLITFDGDKMATVPFKEWPAAMNKELGRFKAEFERRNTPVPAQAPQTAPPVQTAKTALPPTAAERIQAKEKQMVEILQNATPVYILGDTLKNIDGSYERHYDKGNCGLSDGRYVIIGNNIFFHDNKKVRDLQPVIAEFEANKKAAAAKIDSLNRDIAAAEDRVSDISVSKEENRRSTQAYSDAQNKAIRDLNKRISSLKSDSRDVQKVFLQNETALKELQNSLDELSRTRQRLCDKYPAQAQTPVPRQ